MLSSGPRCPPLCFLLPFSHFHGLSDPWRHTVCDPVLIWTKRVFFPLEGRAPPPTSPTFLQTGGLRDSESGPKVYTLHLDDPSRYFEFIYINSGFSHQVRSDPCDLMDCSPPGSSVHEIFQARILEWVAIPFSRGSSPPRDWTLLSWIAGRFFTYWATREANIQSNFG